MNIKLISISFFLILYGIIGFAQQRPIGVWKIIKYSSSQKLSAEQTQAQKLKVDSLNSEITLTFNENGEFFREGFLPYKEAGKWNISGNKKRYLVTAMSPFFKKDSVLIEKLGAGEMITSTTKIRKNKEYIFSDIRLKKKFGSALFASFPEGTWKIIHLERSTSPTKEISIDITVITDSKGFIKLNNDGSYTGKDLVEPTEDGNWAFIAKTNTLILTSIESGHTSKFELTKESGKIIRIKNNALHTDIEKIIIKTTYKKQK